MFRVSELTVAAESGDQYSQFLLGFLFHTGCLVARDLGLAQQWYEKSALQGFSLAQYGLYKVLWEKNDNETAIDWLKKAADANYAPAQAAIASYYWRVSQSPDDRQLALDWMLMAANHGHFPAIANVALMFEEGLSGDPSREMAISQLRKGAELGSATCAQMLADRLLNEEAGTPEIEEGLRWLWYAAENGESFAYGRLADIYRYGQYNTPVDSKIADLLDKMASELVAKII